MTESASQGPGAELKAAREGMEVSTREVADALNLPTHVIEALEADDHDRLPPTVFTRGYLRSYARLLELDSDRLLASYPEVTGEVDLVTGETAVVTHSVRVPKEAIGIAVAVAVVLAGLLVWLLTGDEDEADRAGEPTAAARTEIAVQTAPVADAQPSEEPPSGETTAETEPATGTDADREADTDLEPGVDTEPETASEVPVPRSATAEPDAAEETRTPAQPAAVTAEPAGISVEPAAIAEPSAIRERRITEFGDDVLTMVFREDCWVEVSSLDEVNLYSDLNRAGQTLILTGRAPFRLRLGYAPGVTLSFNGEALSLQRHSRNNVANLVIGE